MCYQKAWKNRRGALDDKEIHKIVKYLEDQGQIEAAGDGFFKRCDGHFSPEEVPRQIDNIHRVFRVKRNES